MVSTGPHGRALPNISRNMLKPRVPKAMLSSLGSTPMPPSKSRTSGHFEPGICSHISALPTLKSASKSSFQDLTMARPTRDPLCGHSYRDQGSGFKHQCIHIQKPGPSSIEPGALSTESFSNPNGKYVSEKAPGCPLTVLMKTYIPHVTA